MGHTARSPGAGAARFLSHLRLASRSMVALIALFSGLAMTSKPALAAGRPETFGPAKVACQPLGAGQFDCLLTSLMISENGNNVATFSLATLPAADQAVFQRWCFTVADDCTVIIQGTRMAPGSTRLSSVTSVRWTRTESPRNQSAARAIANRASGN